MSDSSISNDDKVLNVKQRTFAVAKRDDRQSVLRTGNLGPCVAFYGIDRTRGIAFMSHVDGKTLGLNLMAKRLLAEAEGDLSGFELYITTNYTLTLRMVGLVVLICICLSLIDKWQLLIAAIALGAVFCHLFFTSMALAYIFARIWFKTWKIALRMPKQFQGQIEVEVDATSSIGPDVPRRDTLSAKEREAQYGPPHSWFKNMRQVEREE